MRNIPILQNCPGITKLNSLFWSLSFCPFCLFFSDLPFCRIDQITEKDSCQDIIKGWPYSPKHMRRKIIESICKKIAQPLASREGVQRNLSCQQMERKLCLLQCDASNSPLFPLPSPPLSLLSGGDIWRRETSRRPPCLPRCSPQLSWDNIGQVDWARRKLNSYKSLWVTTHPTPTSPPPTLNL